MTKNKIKMAIKNRTNIGWNWKEMKNKCSCYFSVFIKFVLAEFRLIKEN